MSMLRWAARVGLVRFLGRRAIPVLFAYDAIQLARSLRRGRSDRARRRTETREPEGRERR